MEIKVTGCRDCRFYLSQADRYLSGCGHPNKPIKIGYYVSGRFYSFEEGVFTKEELKEIPILYKQQPTNTLHYKGHSIWVEGFPIEEDANFRPITPDWCPLKKESITISFDNSKEYFESMMSIP